MDLKRALLLILLCGFAYAEETQHDDASAAHEESSEEEYKEPGVAVLFPWFTVGIGILIYLVLSRWACWLPYTLVMFTLGTIIAVVALQTDNQNLLTESIVDYWIHIDGEVLLLVFLPGLLMKDAMSMNVHLFSVAFGQCVIFAFPMVLAGTGLTALIGMYILPWGWSFDFSMMFGAILSATDPVAVAALLEQVGAPPRLKTHIAGEALLNDGSAIVFFTIFSQRWLNSLGEGNSPTIGWGEGFIMFIRMSLGGAAVGVFFAIGLLGILKILKRRLSREENVVEVTSITAMAYLCYFTADFVWSTSGVISVVTLGIVTNSYSHGVMNDAKLNEDFGSVLEHLLNTVLFTLGGLVWGGRISNAGDYSFAAKDWGYLILTYILAVVIRLVLFSVCYPITRNIGLRTNKRETLFQVWGGLRGAVGIALAIYTENLVTAIMPEGDESRVQVGRLFAIVGGVAFLTLSINATTAGPLLRKLGLADSGEVREKIIHAVRDHG
jgi:NhaP-type Na+/H+ or K+/H+ antiporter